MPLNKQVFITRSISALVFALVMIGGTLWSPWSFLLLFIIIHTGCWFEYVRLIDAIFGKATSWITLIGFMLSGTAVLLLFCGKIYSFNGGDLASNFLVLFSAAGFILLSLDLLRQSQSFSLKHWLALAGGLLYISLPWGLMISLRQIGIEPRGAMQGTDLGFVYPLFLIFSIWINDTMAYIVGSLIGKTPLSAISPKKTWEGTLGGMILCVVVMTGLGSYLKLPLSISMGVSLSAAIMGTLGDLWESFLKRKAGVKDSGNMMPGHGGFLDRFDSLLWATPFAWLVVRLATALQ